MKNRIFYSIIILLVLVSCSSLKKTAFKYWSKKQVKEFVQNCETKSATWIGEEKAKQYCDCAVNVVAEKYHNYEDVKKASIIEVLKIAKDCK